MAATRIFGFSVLCAFLLLAAFLLIPRHSLTQTDLNTLELDEASSLLSAPELGDSGWNLESLNRIRILQDSIPPDSWQNLSPEDFSFPELPKDTCGIIEKLTGKPCLWEVRTTTSTDGNEIVEVTLKSGDQLLAKGQSMRVETKAFLDKYKGTMPAEFESAQYAWIPDIEVAKWLQSLGFGKIAWLATDLVSKYVSTRLGERTLVIFADASKIKWGESMLAKYIPPELRCKLDIGLWLYFKD